MQSRSYKIDLFSHLHLFVYSIIFYFDLRKYLSEYKFEEMDHAHLLAYCCVHSTIKTKTHIVYGLPIPNKI